MIDDLRSAVRSLSRSKALTAVLLLSLALGTGANAAVFGVINALLLGDPPGVRAGGELVSIYTSEFSGDPFGRSSLPDFDSVAALPSVREAAAADDSRTANVRLGSASRAVRVVSVTPGFFPLLRMRPHAGRLLTDGDDALAPPAAVISFALAQLAGDPHDTVGQRLTVGEETFTVVGVAAPKFRGMAINRPADVWIPLPRDAAIADRGDRRLTVLARRNGDAGTLGRDLDTLSDQLATAHPTTNRGAMNDADAPRRITAVPYARQPPGAGAGMTILAIVIVGATALLLASACVNAGTLLLARAMARRHEVAIKMALGAPRRRLVLQLLAESLGVSIAGGVLGLLFAVWTTRSIPALFAPEHAELLDTSISPLLVLLTVGVATVAGVLCGIAPAVHGTEGPAVAALRADSGGVSAQHGGARLRSVLITAQLAVSTLLLAATGLLMNTLTRALDATSGPPAGDLALASFVDPAARCTVPHAVLADDFARRFADALPPTAEIEAVGWAATPPLGRPSVRPYAIQAGARLYDRADFDVNAVTPGYFEALSIPLVEGRLFDERDGARAQPVAVVDELLARRHFGAAALGQHLVDGTGEPIRIVGVVRTPRYRTLQDEPQPVVYRPLVQDDVGCGFLFVRTRGDALALLPAITGVLENIDPRATVSRALTFDQHLSEALVVDRLTTRMVAMCGLIALVLGAIGVYGAMNDAVVRRTREIGLRLALGARRAHVVRLIGAEALYLSAAGILLGLGGTVALERFAAMFVHGLGSIDAVVLVRTSAMLAIVIAAAAAVPLHRALRVNPTVALRAE